MLVIPFKAPGGFLAAKVLGFLPKESRLVRTHETMQTISRTIRVILVRRAIRQLPPKGCDTTRPGDGD
jgi:hypothetical protein